LVFPNPSGGAQRMRVAVAPMHAGGVQAAMRAAVADCGIRLRITAHSLRHYSAYPIMPNGQFGAVLNAL
jgi:integrase